MAVIGSFGPDPSQLPEPEHYDEFIFCGERFVVPEMTALPMTRFAWDSRRLEGLEERLRGELRRAEARQQVAEAAEDTASAAIEMGRVVELRGRLAEIQIESMAMIYQMLSDSIGEQWPEFESLAVRYRVGQEVLMDVIAVLMQHATNRPTLPSGDSSSGPSTNGTTSPAGSTLQEPPRGPTTPAAVTGRVLTDRELARAEIVAGMVPVSGPANHYTG